MRNTSFHLICLLLLPSSGPRRIESQGPTDRWFNWEAARHLRRTRHNKTAVPLHFGSGWNYMSAEQFDAHVWGSVTRLLSSQLAAGHRVFEVGVGVGAALITLKQHVPGLELLGCDISETALRVARLHLPGTTLFKCDAVRANYSRLPENAVHHAMSNGALAMYAPSLDALFVGVRELVRITKVGGTVLLTHVAPDQEARGSIKTVVPISCEATALNQAKVHHILSACHAHTTIYSPILRAFAPLGPCSQGGSSKHAPWVSPNSAF